MAAAAGLYFWARRRNSPQYSAAFLVGWAILVLALVSPLCRLSVALFSAREAQHVLITVVAAPLLAIALRPILSCRLPGALSASVLFAVVLWFWHVPHLYQLTFTSKTVYWFMHATMVLSAIVLWVSLLDPARPGTALVSAFFTMLQMSLLGALLTFSQAALYGVHRWTTGAWGLSQLEDQQLGGLIMWVPTTLVFLLFTLHNVGFLIRVPQPNKLSQ
jgi:putative membrane protein